jgi:signal transduction histidine kinase/ActR/RegA family two-component response regulator
VTPKAPKLLTELRLRSKLLISLVLTIAALSCSTLFVVGYSGEKHARQEVAAGAHTSLLTFDVLFHQDQQVLAQKADLLATKAAMATDGEVAAGAVDSGNSLESEGSELVAVANASGNIVEFHIRKTDLPTIEAQEMLWRSLKNRSTADWWYLGGSLYQVALQQFGHRSGTVVVGREIDYRAIHDMGRISAGQIAFSYGDKLIASTFGPIEEQNASEKLRYTSSPRQIALDNDQFFVDSMRLNGAQDPVARLIVLKSYSEATAFLTSLNHLLLGIGVLAVLAGAGFVFFISDTFTRPLAELLGGFQALERGDYAYPLHAQGGDEVAHATRAFERMRSALQKNEAQKENLEDQLRQAQKMEALGRLAGGVAHDFNNLLTVIKGHSELIMDRMKPGDPVLSSGEQIRKAADRAVALTRQMLAFSRKQALQPKVLEVNGLVDDLGKLLERLIPEDIEVIFRSGKSLGRVKADPGQLEQVLLNLTVNARDAMPRGGKLTIETKDVTLNGEIAQFAPSLQPGRFVKLSVSDTGSGMDANTKAHIFEPFFTTKEPGKGTGLGLATVYGVVKQTGGFIRVDTEMGVGSTFEIYLPRVDDHEVLEAAAVGKNSFVRKSPRQTVLLAEDEAEVRAVTREFLISAGYRVLTAEDGEQALQIAEHDKSIDILVTDVVMPRMRGPELAKRLTHLRPDLKVVYVSGYIEHDKVDGDFMKDACFLNKPFSRDMLVKQIGEAMRKTGFAGAPVSTIAN